MVALDQPRVLADTAFVIIAGSSGRRKTPWAARRSGFFYDMRKFK
jgi:hypothetical protein